MSFTELDTNISMDLREQQCAFLITYSQADIRKMPSCLRFIEIILEAFNFTSSSRRVVQTVAIVTTLPYFFQVAAAGLPLRMPYTTGSWH